MTKLINKFQKGKSIKQSPITPVAPELQENKGYYYQPIKNNGNQAIYEEQKWLYEHGFYNGVEGNKGAKEVDGLLGSRTQQARQAAAKAGYVRGTNGKYTKQQPKTKLVSKSSKRTISGNYNIPMLENNISAGDQVYNQTASYRQQQQLSERNMAIEQARQKAMKNPKYDEATFNKQLQLYEQGFYGVTPAYDMSLSQYVDGLMGPKTKKAIDTALKGNYAFDNTGKLSPVAHGSYRQNLHMFHPQVPDHIFPYGFTDEYTDTNGKLVQRNPVEKFEAASRQEDTRGNAFYDFVHRDLDNPEQYNLAVRQDVPILNNGKWGINFSDVRRAQQSARYRYTLNNLGNGDQQEYPLWTFSTYQARDDNRDGHNSVWFADQNMSNTYQNYMRGQVGRGQDFTPVLTGNESDEELENIYKHAHYNATKNKGYYYKDGVYFMPRDGGDPSTILGNHTIIYDPSNKQVRMSDLWDFGGISTPRKVYVAHGFDHEYSPWASRESNSGTYQVDLNEELPATEMGMVPLAAKTVKNKLIPRS